MKERLAAREARRPVLSSWCAQKRRHPKLFPSECVCDDGESVFRHACKLDLEGIVAGGIELLQRPPARDAWENKVERLRNAWKHKS